MHGKVGLQSIAVGEAGKLPLTAAQLAAAHKFLPNLCRDFLALGMCGPSSPKLSFPSILLDLLFPREP